jgi:hypothetical protein
MRKVARCLARLLPTAEAYAQQACPIRGGGGNKLNKEQLQVSDLIMRFIGMLLQSTPSYMT